MKVSFLAIVALSVSIFFSFPAFAASNNYAQELGCRIDFNIAILNSIASADSNRSSSLQPPIALLNNDKSQLQLLQNQTGIKNFNQQYASDMKQVRDSVFQWRSATGSKFSLGKKASLLQSYQQAQSAYDQCRFSALQAMAQNRINEYQSQVSRFQNVSNQWAARGFDAASLNQLLKDAQSQTIQPLQNAISSANDSESIYQALRAYCLFDGCVNGTNFHLEAKFDAARLNVVYHDLQNNSAAFNLNNTLLTQASQSLSDAQSTLNQVGTAAYASQQSQTIYGDIKSASAAIAQIVREIDKKINVGLK